MNKYTSEKTSDKKYYVLFETDEEGIRQYKAASEQERIGTSLTKMRVEGEIVPAIKLEVDKSTYDTFKGINGWKNTATNRKIAASSAEQAVNPDFAPAESQTLNTRKAVPLRKPS